MSAMARVTGLILAAAFLSAQALASPASPARSLSVQSAEPAPHPPEPHQHGAATHYYYVTAFDSGLRSGVGPNTVHVRFYAKTAHLINKSDHSLTEIYTRAAKGKGDGGGAFVIENQAAKAKYLSKPLIELWAKADAHTPKGDVGPVDFDPVTNSQEPNVKSFKLVPEKLEADKAVVAVTISGRGAPRPKSVDNTIRYNLVRDDGQWKIDDIGGASDGEAWSIRSMLTDSLKN